MLNKHFTNIHGHDIHQVFTIFFFFLKKHCCGHTVRIIINACLIKLNMCNTVIFKPKLLHANAIYKQRLLFTMMCINAESQHDNMKIADKMRAGMTSLAYTPL